MDYEVERIVSHGYNVDNNNERMYYLRWVGYDRDGDSWEPLACLEGSEELRKEYDKKNPASNKGSRIRVWAGNQYFVEAEPTESAAVSTPAKKDKKEKSKTKPRKKSVEEVSDFKIPASHQRKRPLDTSSDTVKVNIQPPTSDNPPQRPVASTSKLSKPEVSQPRPRAPATSDVVRPTPTKNTSNKTQPIVATANPPPIKKARTVPPPPVTKPAPAAKLPPKKPTPQVAPVLPPVRPNVPEQKLPSFKKKTKEEKAPPLRISVPVNPIIPSTSALSARPIQNQPIRSASSDPRRRVASGETATPPPPPSTVVTPVDRAAHMKRTDELALLCSPVLIKKEILESTEPRARVVTNPEVEPVIVRAATVPVAELAPKPVPGLAIMPAKSSLVNGDAVADWEYIAELVKDTSNSAFAIHPATLIATKEFFHEKSPQWQQIENGIISEKFTLCINKDLPAETAAIDFWDEATSLSDMAAISTPLEEFDQIILALNKLMNDPPPFTNFSRYIILTGDENDNTEPERRICSQNGIEMISFERLKGILSGLVAR